MSQKRHQRQKQRSISKKIKACLITFIVYLLGTFVFFALFSDDKREGLGLLILTGIVIFLVANLIFLRVTDEKSKKINVASLCCILLGIFIPTVYAINNPEWSVLEVFQGDRKIEAVETEHDEELVEQVEEDVAIETVVKDIDFGVFKQFYDISYVKEGTVCAEPEVIEDEKIQSVMDLIIKDIYLSDIEKKEYTDSELNSGEYSELTREANKEENLYTSTKEQLNRQEKIDAISSYLRKRLDAYNIYRTCDLARLIGNTYAELADHQTVNENIYSNCSAISHYIDYCYLSNDQDRSKMYYQIGVRFNRIANIAKGVYEKEGSAEYKNLYIDSIYMSIAYYQLCRQSIVDDYKNNLYLARCYEVLADEKDGHDKIAYLEETIDILNTLVNKNDIKINSKKSAYGTLYNALVEYRSMPEKYWSKYTSKYLDEQIRIYQKLVS